MSRKSNRKETREERKTGNRTVQGDALTVVRVREYGSLVVDITKLLEHSRRASARSVNAIMTATYWEIDRRIVEFEQKGEKRNKFARHRLANSPLFKCLPVFRSLGKKKENS